MNEFVLDRAIRIIGDEKKFSAAMSVTKDMLDCIVGKHSGNGCEFTVEMISADIEDESYRLVIDKAGAKVYASGIRGAIYGVSAIIERIRFSSDGMHLSCCDVCERPNKSFRGIHLYLPARKDIEAFKRIAKVLALLRLNTMILEVGAGMEYDRHPEINQAWEKLCRTLDNDFPGFGGSRSLQGSDFYWKDSVHTELGGGSYLTKDEVRDILEFCKGCGLHVIPEIQALSHSYYLTIPHREIAERQDDAFPDTYCPLNEESYKLYFDVADEVIEVFKPDTVSIGHDEIRILGWCDKCKGKSGHELVSYEINRLHDFYKERGIRIMMWGDVAQRFVNYLGTTVGGLEIDKTVKGVRYFKPATYESINSLPSDIIMLDWYHSMGASSQDSYIEHGHEVVYGNLHGSCFAEWNERSALKGVLGAEVSTWCAPTEAAFAEDGIFFELLFSSYILWHSDCSNEKYEGICEAILPIIPAMRSIMRNEQINSLKSYEPTCYFTAPDSAEISLDLTSARIPNTNVKSALDTLGDKPRGIRVIGENVVSHPNDYADSLMFLHNTNGQLPFCPSYEFLDHDSHAVGTYAVIYEDNDYELVSLYYGREIGTKDYSITRHRRIGNSKGGEIDIDIGAAENAISKAAYFDHDFSWHESLCYFTTPIICDDGTAFLYEWKNPHPEKKITMIKGISVAKKDELECTLFGIVGIKSQNS